MDRRSGLKKAHFSSVPTRMSLFTCKKYVFLIEKNFPNLTTPHSKIGKTQHNAFLKLNASLPKGRSAGRVGKLSTTLSYGSRWKTQHNALYESRCGVGYGSLNDPCSMSFFTGYGYIITFISSA
ncbi:hypothetical protein LEP1GSC037_2634 [Leptospira interrogans str. 2006001854]|uniref:Uncharacterized protein n=1 Tax=Leptospira interrogans str. 2006001854 TaxID=1001590 RepID=M6GI18_LEPIR|nr:hypothetical protein LEP1GSC037_2634 [Leptospira interrogans str. 2006001854]